jgi:EmrB/QacA subfamily drug resistance transporter
MRRTGPGLPLLHLPGRAGREGRDPSAAQLALTLLVAGAFFMENLDGTIIATPAPVIARQFGVAPAAIGTAMTAYLVAAGALIPVSGWVCDRWGARRTFTTALVVFSAASGLCAASSSLGELVVLRVLQGAAGALMVPVGRLVVLRETAKRDLIRAIAVLTWPALVAPILAPVLGGALAAASWRWIFLVNLPLGAVAIAVSLRVVPQVRAPVARRLDTAGFIISALSLALLMFAASLLGSTRILWAPVAVCALGGCVLGVLGVRHLLRSREPLIELDALRVRTFRVAHAGGSLFRAAVFAVPFLLPLMFEEEFGWTPVRAGSMVTFVFVGNLAVKPATTPLLRGLGFRTVITASALALAVTTAATGLATAGTPTVVLALLLTAGGAFRSIGFTGYNTLAFADIDRGAMTHANTLASTIQQLAQGVGVALAILALRAGRAVAGSSQATAFHLAFAALGALALVAALEAAALPRDAGAHLNARPATT